MTEFPSHLYHYTSIENLALILSTKTIRFNRLDSFNDLDEGTSNDLAGIKSHVFGSCWTGSADENIPLWKLYTDMKGCRIRLPVNPFNGDLVRGNPENVDLSGTHIRLCKPVNYEPAWAYDDEEWPIDLILGPTEIDYTHDSKKFAPSVVIETGSGAKFNAWGIGLTKKKHWSFEKEWRYRIHTSPEESVSDVFLETKDGNLSSFREPALSPPRNRWIDVPIRKEALEDLEIMLAPNAGDAGHVIARALAPGSTPIVPSGLHIRAGRD